jgi:hypothetical protein
MFLPKEHHSKEEHMTAETKTAQDIVDETSRSAKRCSTRPDLKTF